MKEQLIWWAGFGILSAIVIGIVTGFKFNELDIQLHDTYFVLQSRDAIVLLTLAFGFGRYFYLLADLISSRFKILALIMSIINAIVGLFVIIITYLSAEGFITFQQTYRGTCPGHLIFTIALTGLLFCSDNS
jgi:hypothetical protein